MKTSQRKENKKRKRLEKDSYCTKKDSSRLRDREVKASEAEGQSEAFNDPNRVSKSEYSAKDADGRSGA